MLRRDRQHLHDEGASAGSGVGMASPNRYPQPVKLTGRPSELPEELKLGLEGWCDPLQPSNRTAAGADHKT